MGHPPHMQTNQSSGLVIVQCGRCQLPLETSKTLYNVLGSCGTKHTIPSTCGDRKHTFSNTSRSVKYCLPTNNWENLYTDKTLGGLFVLPHSWLLNNFDLEATIFKCDPTFTLQSEKWQEWLAFHREIHLLPYLIHIFMIYTGIFVAQQFLSALV